jgi:DNA-binding response OmpR family regulator
VQQKRRVLVVEPDDLILGLLERWLGEAGYTVLLQSSQTPAGESQLVIIDVPDPLGAGKIIQSVRETHAGPILLLSARFRRGTGSSNSVAQQLGVSGVLPKPFTSAELLSAVSESIGNP